MSTCRSRRGVKCRQGASNGASEAIAKLLDAAGGEHRLERARLEPQIAHVKEVGQQLGEGPKVTVSDASTPSSQQLEGRPSCL